MRLPIGNLGAPLAYVERGWPTFPLHHPVDGRCSCRDADCTSPAKHPRTPHGLYDATTDPGQVIEWWRRWPLANIGLRTGVVFDVLDIDGQEGLDALNGARAGVPVTWGPEARTGGGGWHLPFLATGAGNRTAMLPKVDWRGVGGYIVAPPSLHISGRRYEWADELGAGADEPLEPAPDWLRELVLPTKPTTTAVVLTTTTTTRCAGAYGQRALDAELGKVAMACEGDRNHQLNRSAFALGQLVGGGVLEVDLVVAKLVESASRAGLAGREVEGTITSGLRKGIRNPRKFAA